jgi:hypothetical protein
MASKLKVDQISTVSETGTLSTSGNIKLNLTSSTSGLVLPQGTEAQRDSTATFGELRGNTDNNTVEFYNGTSWQRVQTTPAVDNSIVAMHYNVFTSTLNTSSAGAQNYVNHPGSQITLTTTEDNSSFMMIADLAGYQEGTGSGVNIAFEFNGVRYAGINGANGDHWMAACHSGVSSGSFNMKKIYIVSPNLPAGTTVDAYIQCGHWSGTGNHHFNYYQYTPSSTFVIKEFVNVL